MADRVVSKARLDRRSYIVEAASALVGAATKIGFDAVRADLCAIDVVMVAGSPWLKDGIERDFVKDESGYRKLGGSSNTPEQAYFFRSGNNLVHYFKRAGFYVPRGGVKSPAPGMACFFDWEDRGRYNFTPDRSGIIIDVKGDQVSEVIIALPIDDGIVVQRLKMKTGDERDRALIGYSDLP
ncbi:MAG: hypothetical protein GY822_20875 [Deltaproteobacteria bacterium]|nr:hypothetical protein [Deltaproteobacteria bacterium]